MHLRLAAVAFTSHSNGRRLFFPLLNNLYSHSEIKPNVPRMQLKCQPHRWMPSEEGKGREWQRLLSTHRQCLHPGGGYTVCSYWESQSVVLLLQGNKGSLQYAACFIYVSEIWAAVLVHILSFAFLNVTTSHTAIKLKTLYLLPGYLHNAFILAFTSMPFWKLNNMHLKILLKSQSTS